MVMLAMARIFVLLALAFAAGNSAVLAQDAEDIRYQEDYDRLQEIVKVSDPAKKADQLLGYYKGRPNLDSKLRVFADSNFANALLALMKQPALVKKFSQTAIALRPKFGEAWFYYGVILKNDSSFDEALMAFAKSSLIENSLQTKAKQMLDATYRGTHKGSLIGEDKLIAIAKAELK
jgi:hypothetical protein